MKKDSLVILKRNFSSVKLSSCKDKSNLKRQFLSTKLKEILLRNVENKFLIIVKRNFSSVKLSSCKVKRNLISVKIFSTVKLREKILLIVLNFQA